MSDEALPVSQVSEAGAAINLASLRTELALRFCLLLIASGCLGLWFCIPISPFPVAIFGLLTLLVLHSFTMSKLIVARPALGRQLLIVGLCLLLTLSMLVLETPWFPFIGLPLVFASAVLWRHSELVVTGALCLLVLTVPNLVTRDYFEAELQVLLVFSAASSSLVSGTVFTALSWESQTRQETRALLSEVRNQRGRLSQMVKSLNQAYEQEKRMQQELIRARQVAEEARRLKEQFAANISHELRTPLNLVLGFSEVMYRSPEVYGDLVWPPKLRRDIAQVYRNTRHLVEMIDDILDLSRVEITSFALNIEPTPLSPLILEVAQIAQEIFQNPAVNFVVDTPPELPTVDLDRTRVRQVLLNLINNAARFTEQGSIKLSVHPADGNILFQVEDTGIGIPPEKLPYLFSEFFQVDSSVRRSRGGAGLGLAISKKFVDAHGGHIWVDSVENVGTTFSFTLPIDSTQRRAGRAKRSSSEINAQRPRLLLVNVDAPATTHIARYLSEFEVVAVENAEELDAATKDYSPSAVLWNNAGRLLQESSASSRMPVPVIKCPLSFACADPPQPMPLERLSKPVTPSQLLDTLERFNDVEHILVIDDDVGFTQLMERFIETSPRGYKLTQAFTGYDGLTVIREQRPDLVLLGSTLSDLQAPELLEVIAHDPGLRDIQVILVTVNDPLGISDSVVSGQITIDNSLGFKPGEMLHLLDRILESLAYPRSR